MSSEQHEFKAEVNALLNLVTNSLYTNREIFLRELISNASDALDKARFEALIDDNLLGKDEDPEIRIHADASRGVLVIEDNGIGMNRDEVQKNLGTIAHSGTLRYLEEAKKAGKPADLIGQFGVGFYSAFMVADTLIVDSLSARQGAEPVRWSSKGDGRFDLAPSDRKTRGTRIELHLKEDAKEFLERFRIQHIVKRYSNYVMHPVNFSGVDAEGKALEVDEASAQLNAASAIWARSASELSDDDYKEFYTHVMGGFVLPGDEPKARLHFSADAPIQFDALLFLPGRVPPDLFNQERKSLQLFARRVLIMEDCDKLLPQYLRFFRGVVDSADLPLNVSREMLQEHKSLSAIRRQLTRKALRLLTDEASDNPENYKAIWEQFGSVIKEGLHTDSGQRKELLKLLRWNSIAKDDELLSLDSYLEAMPEGQEFIFYIAGEDEASLRNSPHLEGLRSKGYDVLLMTDPVDEWVLQSLGEYEGKELRSVTQGELDSAEEKEGEEKEDEASPIDPLLSKASDLLGERVKQVRASKRLTETAACLVDDAGGMSRNMERILRMTQPGMPTAGLGSARILELNPDHTIVKAANALSQKAPDDTRLGEWVELLYDIAGLAEGQVADPAGTVKRIQGVLTQIVSASDLVE